MSKYTPGPWYTAPNDESLVMGPNSNVIGQRVAEAHICATIPRATMEANARLIAAAPTLLEAAEDALSMLRTCIDIVEDDQFIPDIVKTLRKLGAAVADATGDEWQRMEPRS